MIVSRVLAAKPDRYCYFAKPGARTFSPVHMFITPISHTPGWGRGSGENPDRQDTLSQHLLVERPVIPRMTRYPIMLVHPVSTRRSHRLAHTQITGYSSHHHYQTVCKFCVRFVLKRFHSVRLFVQGPLGLVELV
ncbi:hypothetical protein RRG08_064137 [Elysia crispata]|uniref:Uncharacterized protein n=1 Tax=Elysia crispata TaxID=231223 RepID=A0AAE1DJP3_9GAST|nr:hypothetical protein RRG08_064137 [Elysia crispata]